MTNKAKIIEIFESIQGEGPFIGYKQLFIRFANCNLRCRYCDTNFIDSDEANEYTVSKLATIINNANNVHSVSLTGGEPLLHSDFLTELLPQCKQAIYLETNATLYKELNSIIDYIEYIAADIKLPSCSGCSDLWEKHEKFFDIAKEKQLFAKVVFDENITDLEIKNCVRLVKKYNIELVLQPKMTRNSFGVTKDKMEEIFNKVNFEYKNVRLVPQVQKFINVR